MVHGMVYAAGVIQILAKKFNQISDSQNFLDSVCVHEQMHLFDTTYAYTSLHIKHTCLHHTKNMYTDICIYVFVKNMHLCIYVFILYMHMYG